jgi:hypothetical protein
MDQRGHPTQASVSPESWRVSHPVRTVGWRSRYPKAPDGGGSAGEQTVRGRGEGARLDHPSASHPGPSQARRATCRAGRGALLGADPCAEAGRAPVASARRCVSLAAEAGPQLAHARLEERVAHAVRVRMAAGALDHVWHGARGAHVVEDRRAGILA